MAKKKATAAKKRKTRAAAPVQETAAVLPPQKPVFKYKNLLAIAVAVLIIISIFEVIPFVSGSFKKVKNPALLYSWTHNYGGCTSISECGPNIYGIDNTRGDIYVNEKVAGTFLKKVTIPEGVLTISGDSAGNIFVLDRKNEILKLDPKTFKTVKKTALEGAGNYSWMDIDSKDNFYAANSSTQQIVKFNSSFVKTGAFGGPGGGREGFDYLGKIAAGPGDDIYALNFLKDRKLEIKVFTSDGKYKYNWTADSMKSIDSYSGIAVAPDGDVYLSSMNDAAVYVYSAQGRHLGTFNQDDAKTFTITYIASICGGRNGVIYVATSKMAAFGVINYGK
ncbi:MAG: hypothetical protein ABSA34_04420 [Candidatus Goldiibacteriota bacterium]|jgi:hypothetical protein